MHGWRVQAVVLIKVKRTFSPLLGTRLRQHLQVELRDILGRTVDLPAEAMDVQVDVDDVVQALLYGVPRVSHFLGLELWQLGHLGSR